MPNTIDAVNYSGFAQAQIENLPEGNGVFCDTMVEPFPNYISSTSEKVTQHGNSWIVLGRDVQRQERLDTAGKDTLRQAP